MKLKSIFRAFKNPRHALLRLVEINLAYKLSDINYLRLIFFIVFGKRLNLKNPRTFNEKLSWLKIYGRRDIYTTMADKYAAKQFVASQIGREHVVENYGVYEKWTDIKFDELPEEFVIKCTHDSGGAFICRNKINFNKGSVQRQIEKNLNRDYFHPFREWPYKNIPHRIIVDRLLDDKTGSELRDYKFWCFNGVPKYMYCTIKGKNIYENFYDMDFHPVPIDHGFPRHTPEFEKPFAFEEMKTLASKLSQGVPFVRVDFFYVEGTVYFGEFTFYDWAGLRPFRGNWDKELGKLILLPQI